MGGARVDASPTIAAGSNIVTFTLKAESDASVVSNHHVRITAKGADGLSTTEGFGVSVQP